MADSEDVNGIAASSLGSSMVANQVNIAVARKALDAQKAQGAAAVSMLQQAAQLQKQMVANVSVEPGKGTLIDVTA